MASAQVVSQPLLIATFDFGTTFSGYAFETVANLKEDILQIHRYCWDLQNGYVKTPTCVLFDPDQNFNSFGRDAEDKYTELAQQNDHANWYYFRRFILDLYKCQNIPRNFTLKDVKGKRLPAMKVISESIEYMREHLMRELKRVRQGHPVMIRPSEIRWIVTVPAIWSNAAKQFMREAAEKGGMPSSRLKLVLESEAAFTFCYQTNKERVFHAEKSMQCGFLPGTKCLILDAGGTSIQITVQEVQNDLSIKQLYMVNCGNCGGTKVDLAFENFLEELIGKPAFQRFRNDDKAGYLDLQREFEYKKKSIKPNQSCKVSIKVPMSLVDAFNNVSREDVYLAGNKLRLASEIAVDLIAKPCSYIVSRLKTILDDPKIKGTEIIFMVGGFSASSILQNAVEKVFPSKPIIIPNNAEYAVLMGAVQFEVNPTITCLICLSTHGISTTSPFEEGVDPEDKKFINDDGNVMCRDRFKKLVEIGQTVLNFERFEEQIITPVSSEQLSVAIPIFRSLNKNPRYTDERDCFSSGTIDIKFPDPKRGINRAVGVTLYIFSSTMQVEVRDMYTGEHIPCFWDIFR